MRAALALLLLAGCTDTLAGAAGLCTEPDPEDENCWDNYDTPPLPPEPTSYSATIERVPLAFGPVTTPRAIVAGGAEAMLVTASSAYDLSTNYEVAFSTGPGATVTLLPLYEAHGQLDVRPRTRDIVLTSAPFDVFPLADIALLLPDGRTITNTARLPAGRISLGVALSSRALSDGPHRLVDTNLEIAADGATPLAWDRFEFPAAAPGPHDITVTSAGVTRHFTIVAE